MGASRREAELINAVGLLGDAPRALESELRRPRKFVRSEALMPSNQHERGLVCMSKTLDYPGAEGKYAMSLEVLMLSMTRKGCLASSKLTGQMMRELNKLSRYLTQGQEIRGALRSQE
jgi:hypothetical protein